MNQSEKEYESQSEKEYESRLKKFNDAALEKRELGELMYQKNMCFLEGIDDIETQPPLLPFPRSVAGKA